MQCYTKHLPEIIATLIVAIAFTGLFYRWMIDDLGITGEFVTVLIVLVSIITLFGAERVKEAVTIWNNE